MGNKTSWRMVKGRQAVNVRSAICSVTEAGDIPINMGIVPIWLHYKDYIDKKVRVYALLDNASGGTFVKEDSLRRLGINGTDTKRLLTTMHGTQEIDTKAVDGLVASNSQEPDTCIFLPTTYVRQHIPADRDETPRPERLKGWPHLQRISEKLPPYMEDVEIGILIGLNCPSAVRSRDVIWGKENDPYAVRSLLRWHINGPVSHKDNGTVRCHRIQIIKDSTERNANGLIVAERKAKEQFTPQTVARMFEIDFRKRKWDRIIAGRSPVSEDSGRWDFSWS